MQYVYIFIGGAIGALLRYLLSFLHEPTDLPVGTFIANIIGAFLVGYLSHAAIQLFQDHPNVKKGVTTGFVGALTTFSTFQFEIVQMLNHHQIWLALSYAILSFLAGLTFCMKGFALGGKVKHD
ncbi:fluoride efflux transporter CrcB [Staphylococcus massiliensis]|uniref:Fluoride-specific ion channel FluC n=1 Tax=Staphylococcus massiliensis S46 TaxID=1229783 RepID=K9B951_9STAP|nr:fluoride efflux transporter CrcB [Staphylococcus massiliensis]EKU50295.1 camphor resistance protein CrcB [Staphylococcus massiliensis S46]PNZ99044.1 fluoride efflux transporter CrcB [Staphylococcus massiliensis CCUG 55927]